MRRDVCDSSKAASNRAFFLGVSTVNQKEGRKTFKKAKENIAKTLRSRIFNKSIYLEEARAIDFGDEMSNFRGQVFRFGRYAALDKKSKTG